MRIASVLAVAFFVAGGRASPLDELLIRDGENERRLLGQVLVEHNEGLLLLTRDGQIWPVNARSVLSRTSGEQAWSRLAERELAESLLAELPPGFEAYTTAHYLICHNASRAYAQWCGSLFERLYAAFTNYWKRRGFELREPEGPLVAIVFADRASFAAYSRGEAGAAADALIGFYSLRTNRIATYDLSGIEKLVGNRSRATVSEINQILRRPDAQRTVATLIHEATHQVAFNTGLHARFADIPVWVSEGLAIYFETPDLESQRGWRTIGAVNYPRLSAFRESLADRPPDALRRMIADDGLLRDPKRAAAAYAEAWAWHYFLLKQRAEQYQAYTRILSSKPPKSPWTPPNAAERLADFEAAFGRDFDKLDADFLRFMSRVR